MRQAVIVAHGQPSDPAPAAADLAALAQAVEGHLSGWRIGSATLAEPEAIARETGGDGVIYPLFMAGGWFTRVALPGRLAAAGAVGWQVLEPFGCDPGLHDLAAAIVAEGLVARQMDPGRSRLLLAAHGSFKSPVPSDIARHVAGRIAARTGLARAEAGFIDQSPQLAHATGFGPDSLCLPFFAAAGGHVTEDIPKALAQAGFQGHLLPALGLDARVPALIARAIAAGQPVCAAECRYRAG